MVPDEGVAEEHDEEEGVVGETAHEESFFL